MSRDIQGERTMHARRSVLVVDDYAELRDFVRLAFRDEGYRVRTAEHGTAALQHIGVDTFDVILLDIQMPVMDGVPCVRRTDRCLASFAAGVHDLQPFTLRNIAHQ
jgi:CheY-like chemotaxis protein